MHDDSQPQLAMPDLQAEKDQAAETNKDFAAETEEATCDKCKGELDFNSEHCGACDTATCSACIESNNGEAHHNKDIHDKLDKQAERERATEESIAEITARKFPESAQCQVANDFFRLRFLTLGLARRIERYYGTAGDQSNYLYELADSLQYSAEDFGGVEEADPEMLVRIYQGILEYYASGPPAKKDQPFTSAIDPIILGVCDNVLGEMSEPEERPYSPASLAEQVRNHFAEWLVRVRGAKGDSTYAILHHWTERIPKKTKPRYARLAQEFQRLADHAQRAVPANDSKAMPTSPEGIKAHNRRVKLQIPQPYLYTAIEYLAGTFLGWYGAPPRKHSDTIAAFTNAAKEAAECTADWKDGAIAGEPRVNWSVIESDLERHLTQHLHNTRPDTEFRMRASSWACKQPPSLRAWRVSELLLAYLARVIKDEPSLAAIQSFESAELHKAISKMDEAQFIAYLHGNPHRESAPANWKAHKANYPHEDHSHKDE